VCAGGRATYHVGAGIVWDSDPQSEYEETLAKGLALHAALTSTPVKLGPASTTVAREKGEA
jgi:anthranilate/para-aminobenzoate synthase component I